MFASSGSFYHPDILTCITRPATLTTPKSLFVHNRTYQMRVATIKMTEIFLNVRTLRVTRAICVPSNSTT